MYRHLLGYDLDERFCIETRLIIDATIFLRHLQDATANDIPSDTYDVEGFPTVYLRSASGKLVQYEGDRTKQDIIDFIEKNRDEVAQQEPAKDEL